MNPDSKEIFTAPKHCGNAVCFLSRSDATNRKLAEKSMVYVLTSVADPNPDPDPPDPHVFGPPGSGSGSTSQMFGSGSFYHHAKIVRKTLIPTICYSF